jgi:hypothetical protein
VEDFGRRYYGALGIDRADMAARARQTGRNFLFFVRQSASFSPSISH